MSIAKVFRIKVWLNGIRKVSNLWVSNTLNACKDTKRWLERNERNPISYLGNKPLALGGLAWRSFNLFKF